MDRDSEKKHRDSDRDRHKHRDHHHSKHRSGDADDDRRHRSKHRDDGEGRRSATEYSAEREREKSVDLRSEEEGGRRRIKRERSYEREGSVERKYSQRESVGGSKRARVSEDKNGGSIAAANGNGMEPVSSASRNETNMNQDHSPDMKVISTTNENKGVNSNRSHEVPGKSSTDVSAASASGAGMIGGLTRDHLDKVRKTLLRQKELGAKMKKIPLLNKTAGANRESSPQLGPKPGMSTPSVGTSGLATEGATTSVSSLAAAGLPPHVSGFNLESVRKAQEVAAKMGFRQDPEFGPLINMFPGQMPQDITIQPKPAKAPVLRLDALGREIDEHGNVVNVPKVNALSTLKVNINKQRKDSFQILKPELEVDPEKNPHFDPGMGINKAKLLRPKRMSIQFVEEGKWSKDAESMKLKNLFGEARAKELKAKQAQLAKAKAEPDINPNLIEVAERVITTKEKPKEAIPDVEWWDAPLFHSGSYGDIVDGGLNKENYKTEKVTIYVEHPRPIEPPAEPAPPPPQPLKLTKKEQKKLRTQRRLAREKDKQDMIRQGILEPPKSKVKMSNLMRVLGSEATQDPTKMEREIRTAAAQREQAHYDRNIARKLTPAERREKKERKLFDDRNTAETIVSVYKINNLSHPQARFKVDANAHENRLTGCAVITQGISVVVVEGGQKSIKRYGKLMLRRIDWPAMVQKEGEDDDEAAGDDGPPNKCSLVWQGSVAKSSFNRFFVHECLSEAAARKVFNDYKVAHYWEQALNFTEE